MICENCKKEFLEDYRKDKRGIPRFCSIKCSHSRTLTEESRKKISNKLFGNIPWNKKDLNKPCIHTNRFCSLCNKKISYNNSTNICMNCRPKKTHTEITRENRRKKKLKLIESSGSKCLICGYNKYIGALEFHHKDKTKKDFNITNSNNTSIKACLEEIKKCILVCSNCHREIHAGLIDIGSLV